MFFSCPHCRDLVATDRETNLPPVMCPRCGGVLRKEKTDGDAARARAGLSIAGLLQATTVAAETQEPVVSEPSRTPVDVADVAAEAVPEAEAIADVADEGPSFAANDTDTDTDTETAPDPGNGDGGETNAGASSAGKIDTHGVAAQGPESAESTAPQYLGPSFILQRAQTATHARTAKWQWAAVVLLATTLVLQVLLADRQNLASDAGWRPTISFLCRMAGCSVPAWHQPGAFAMLSRDVSPIKDTAGGLNVQATFRNDARWPQAWPVLLLSLSDADGRVLGARAFSPREYLGATATQTELAPGQSAQIALKLHEPNPDVVAYSFDFR
ncbi:MAG: DUF3426 domain-containing protein [Pseudoxanthomonas sp.]